MESKVAREVMTKDVLTVKSDWPLDHLAEFLIENAISGAPVLSPEGKLVGVVSMTDIVRHDIIPLKEPYKDAKHVFYEDLLAHEYGPSDAESFRFEHERDILVENIMTPMVFNAEEETPATDIADMMIRGRIHRIMITKDEKLTGIVTALDLLNLILAKKEMK